MKKLILSVCVSLFSFGVINAQTVSVQARFGTCSANQSSIMNINIVGNVATITNTTVAAVPTDFFQMKLTSPTLSFAANGSVVAPAGTTIWYLPHNPILPPIKEVAIAATGGAQVFKCACSVVETPNPTEPTTNTGDPCKPESFNGITKCVNYNCARCCEGYLEDVKSSYTVIVAQSIIWNGTPIN